MPFREIVEVIGRRLNLPVLSKSAAEAVDHFGWFAHFAALDNPTSSQWTCDMLGWQPEQIDLLQDLDGQHYFSS